MMRLFFFFFQAEDGIRDAQESRGLGDVYKRQTLLLSTFTFKPLLLHTLPNLSTNPLKLSSDSPQRTKSSAYNREGTLHSSPFSTILTPFPAIPTSNSFITPSIYKLNNQGDITQPCLTPLLILNQSPLTPFILTHASLSSYILLIPFRSLPPTPYITNTCHNASLLTLSYACCKSIKPKYNLFFFSLIFSIICFNVKI